MSLDICDYRNNEVINIYADEYILTEKENFVDSIRSLSGKFDAIICSHNLENCNDRYGKLKAILDKFNNRVKLYLSFQSEKTINFPKNYGCLNYYDDPNHKKPSPRF